MIWINYIRYALLIVFLSGFSARSLAEPFRLEGRVGAFIPSSNRMREFFQDALPFIELEGSYRLSSVWDVWGEVSYIFAKGSFLSYGTSSKIDVVPFALGIRGFFALARSTDGFLGFGGLWSLYREHDCSSWVHQHVSKGCFGFIATGGIQHYFSDRFSMSFFAEYLYQRFNFSKIYPAHFTYRHDVDLSGITIGLGFGYTF